MFSDIDRLKARGLAQAREGDHSMEANMRPLISADSHIEEPPGLWFDEIP